MGGGALAPFLARATDSGTLTSKPKAHLLGNSGARIRTQACPSSKAQCRLTLYLHFLRCILPKSRAMKSYICAATHIHSRFWSQVVLSSTFSSSSFKDSPIHMSKLKALTSPIGKEPAELSTAEHFPILLLMRLFLH